MSQKQKHLGFIQSKFPFAVRKNFSISHRFVYRFRMLWADKSVSVHKRLKSFWISKCILRVGKDNRHAFSYMLYRTP